MPFDLEWRMWRQLRGAFEIDEFIFVGEPVEGSYTFRQAPTMSEALAVLPPTCQRVFLEPTGYNNLYDMPKGDIALILGNTEHDNILHAQVNETFRITTPKSTHLYGINAAAIALAVRYGQ